MWFQQLSPSHVFLLNSVLALWIMQSRCYVVTAFCTEDTNEREEITVTCSCPLENKTITIQDLSIRSASENLSLPVNTTHLRVGQCGDVHLSGPSLTSLSNIHSLHLHDTDRLHISYDFFLQYETRLQVLELSSCGFAALQGSLNIHAHKLTHLLFDKITWDKELKLLLQTEDYQMQEVLSITNSKIKTLGEINISSRCVNKLVLQNNEIDAVLTSTLIQDSQNIVIENNSINDLAFLSLDSNTHSFTLQGNTINSLAMRSLVINNASQITILNNTFHRIERHGLAWLHVSPKHGHFVFSGNRLHGQEDGSLVLYFAAFNGELEVEGNVLHTATCSCNTAMLLKDMTTDSTMRESYAVYELFEKSTLCCDAKNQTKRFHTICRRNSVPWKPVVLIFAIGGVVLGALIAVSRKKRVETHYELLGREEKP